MFLSKDRKSDGDLDVLESVGREHAGDGIEWGESTVLVLAGMELIFFIVAMQSCQSVVNTVLIAD